MSRRSVFSGGSQRMAGNLDDSRERWALRVSSTVEDGKDKHMTSRDESKGLAEAVADLRRCLPLLEAATHLRGSTAYFVARADAVYRLALLVLAQGEALKRLMAEWAAAEGGK